ncbi:MAG TPA: alpha/beta hydrolase family protein [Planctomycetota bacterium]|nr:alpha/beta hydrolase family protein [Planctomycetota bacterium]
MASSHAQPATAPAKPPFVTPFDDLLVDRAGKAITTRAGWEQKRADIRTRFLDLLGEPPTVKPKLDPVILSETACEKYTRFELEYSVHSDEKATAFLCVPKGLKGPAPAVLCLHGTSDDGRLRTMNLGANAGHAWGHHLAERGFVTFCADHFVSGKREPKEGRYETGAFYRRFPRWSAVGKALWEESIAVDFLCSRPEVDAQRIGCMGHSLGGHGTVFFMAYEPRIACGVANCGTTSFLCNPMRLHWSRDKWYIYFPKLRELFLAGKNAPVDFHELIGSIAPRPFLDISALNEPNFEGGEFLPGMFVRVHDVYRLYDANAKLANFTHSAGHDLFHYSRALAYAWLENWLQNAG